MKELFIDFLSENLFTVIAATAIGVLGLWGKLTGNRKRRRAVEKIDADMKKAYNTGFRWGRVDINSIPKADLGFYEQASAEMATLGYTPLGDVEFLHLTEAYPNLRAGVRVFATGHGHVSGAAYHICVRGWMGLLTLLIKRTRNLRVVEFETALDDGRFVITTNAGDDAGLLSAPEKLLKYVYPPEMAAASLLELHVTNVKQLLAGTTPATPIAAHTLEQVMTLGAAQHRLEQEHRQQTGAFTEQELLRLEPDLPEQDRKTLLAEAERLKVGA